VQLGLEARAARAARGRRPLLPPQPSRAHYNIKLAKRTPRNAAHRRASRILGTAIGGGRQDEAEARIINKLIERLGRKSDVSYFYGKGNEDVGEILIDMVKKYDDEEQLNILSDIISEDSKELLKDVNDELEQLLEDKALVAELEKNEPLPPASADDPLSDKLTKFYELKIEKENIEKDIEEDIIDNFNSVGKLFGIQKDHSLYNKLLNKLPIDIYNLKHSPALPEMQNLSDEEVDEFLREVEDYDEKPKDKDIGAAERPALPVIVDAPPKRRAALDDTAVVARARARGGAAS
jgi:hypothetical protein